MKKGNKKRQELLIITNISCCLILNVTEGYNFNVLKFIVYNKWVN